MPVVAKLDMTSRSVFCEMRNAPLVARQDISRKCGDNVRTLPGKASSESSRPKGCGKGGKNNSNNDVGNMDIEDLTVLVAPKNVVVVAKRGHLSQMCQS